MNSARVVLAIGLILGVAVPVAARDVTVHWSELTPYVKDKKVTVMLAQGGDAKGRVAEVRQDTLLFKSNRTVARTSIAQIRIRKNYIWGRVIGAGAGAIIGASQSKEPGTGSRGGTALVSAGLGALVGYGVDLALRFSLTTHIHIAPDVPAAPHDNSTTNFEQ